MNGLLKLIETLQSLDFEVLDHMLEEDHLLLIKVHNYSVFQLHLQFNEEFSIFSALIVIRTESHMFDGDRSDVTSLFAIIAVIFAKFF